MADKKRNIEEDDLIAVMRTESGRRVLGRILEVTTVDESAWNSDARIHARNEGKREIGLWLKSEMMSVDLENYKTLIKEQLDG